MNREHLYRGKRTDNGEWLYSVGIKSSPITTLWNEEDFSWKSVDRNTIGEYTGLCDKNGKNIFEGDIVEFETNVGVNFDYEIKDIWKDVTIRPCAIGGGNYVTRKDQAIVEWNNTKGKWNLKVYNNGKYKRKSLLFTYRESGYEIIGNIYDNPEILGE